MVFSLVFQFAVTHNRKHKRSSSASRRSSTGSKMEVEDEPGYRFSELGITFSQRQLQFLNQYFSEMEKQCDRALNTSSRHDKTKEEETECVIEDIVERLVQRLMCTVGYLDHRFASKFLLTVGSSYEHYKVSQPDEYQYMIRLDDLSWPSLYPTDDEPQCQLLESDDIPQGFAKIKIKSQDLLTKWEEFVTKDGCLHAEKLRDTFAQLVKRSIKEFPIDMSGVDECRVAGGSGKVIDPGILNDMLKVPPNEQFYVAIGDTQKDVHPKPRDFSIKVTTEGSGVRIVIHVPPTKDAPQGKRVKVDLTLALGFDGWPQQSNFPSRVPHGHIDCLHFYNAASKGFYMIPTEPHESVYCNDREMLWEISHATTEMEMLNHYAHNSVPAMVLRILKIMHGVLRKLPEFDGLDCNLTDGTQCLPNKLTAVSEYVLKTLFLYELEMYDKQEHWVRSSSSERVLNILQALMKALKYGHIWNYFIPQHNILLQNDMIEADYQSDRVLLAEYIKNLHKISSSPDAVLLNPTKDVDKQIMLMWDNINRREAANSMHDGNSLNFSERQALYLTQLYRTIENHNKRKDIKPPSSPPPEAMDMTTLTKGTIKKKKAFSTIKRRSKFMSLLRRAKPEVGNERLERLLGSVLVHISTYQQKLPDAPYAVLSNVLSKGTHTLMTDDSEISEMLGHIVVQIIQRLIEQLKPSGKPREQDANDLWRNGLIKYLRSLYDASLQQSWFIEDYIKAQSPVNISNINRFSKEVTGGANPQELLEKAVDHKEMWAR